MSLLDTLIYGYRTLLANNVEVTRRNKLNFIGATVADNPTTKSTDVTIGVASRIIGDGTGYAQVSSASGIVATTTKGKDTDFFLATTTPNATPAAILSYVTTSNRIISVEGIITLFNGGAGYAKYKLDGLYTNVAGTLTKRSTTPADVTTGPESSGSTDVILTLSGTSIVINGAGFSSNNSWTGRVFIHEAAF